MNIKIICGRLGQDGELRRTNSGKAVLNLNVADSEKRGEKEYLSWWKIVVWGKQAEEMAQYCRKGVEIIARGRDEVQTFARKDGSQGSQSVLNAEWLRVCVDTREVQKGSTNPAMEPNFAEDDIPL